MIRALHRIPYLCYRGTVSLVALFIPKARAWIRGRRNMAQDLSGIGDQHRIIWVHSASLGEFEMARPTIQLLKVQFPEHKVLGTFFSPSGYEHRNKDELLDFSSYLPHDQPGQVRAFLTKTRPEMAVFMKYEFWPEILSQLIKSGIPVASVGATFRSGQFLFSPFGGYLKSLLKKLDLIAVQDPESEKLLRENGFTNVQRTGDGRFDNVLRIASGKENFPEVDRFVGNRRVFLAGSCWKADEDCFLPLISQRPDMAFILAPHDVSESNIKRLMARLQVPAYRWSKRSETRHPENYHVLIIDGIGLLSRLYGSAHYAFVGGGFGGGLHNILEPAAHGVPVFFGPRHAKFREAAAMIRAGGAASVERSTDLSGHINRLENNSEARTEMGQAARSFVETQSGAAEKTARLLAALMR